MKLTNSRGNFRFFTTRSISVQECHFFLKFLNLHFVSHRIHTVLTVEGSGVKVVERPSTEEACEDEDEVGVLRSVIFAFS